MQRDEQVDQGDPVAWARAGAIALSKRKARFYGSIALINLVAFALVLKGMPAHALWPYFGPVLGILLVLVSAVAGFYSAVLLTDGMDARKSRR